MRRRILTFAVGAAVVAGLIPAVALAQYGTTTTTTAPTTTTTAGVGGITVPTTVTIPPVTRPTVPGRTTTTLRIRAADINVADLLTGNIAAVLQQLSSSERGEAAQRVADIIREILEAGGVEPGEVTIVGGATLERGADQNTPLTLSFSADGYEPFAVVTFILESDPVLLGTATADEGGSASGSFEVPADVPPGTHTVSAVGKGSDGEPVVNQQTITVPEPADEDAASGDDEVAAPTGDDDSPGALPWILVGSVVGLGILALALSGLRGNDKKPSTASTGSSSR